ncbi:catabolite repressor/activator [Orbaceae bacterium ac157xtp]
MKLDDIARLAGVSRTTASYVINDKAEKYRVSAKTVAKVMQVVEQYNYQPNPVATGLRVGRTHSIGIIIPDLENTSYTRIANHFERGARQKGYQILIACSEDNFEIEKTCITHLKQRQVDAIVVSTSLFNDYSFYKNWDNQLLPLLALDRPLDPQKFQCILGHDKKDAQTLTEAFNKIAKGKTVFLGALPELSVSCWRKEGFEKALKSELIAQTTYIYADDYSQKSAYKVFSTWLNSNSIPQSIFSTSFALLQGALNAIIDKKGILPENLVIATFGDNEFLDFLPCQVISLAQDHLKIADVVLTNLTEILTGIKSYQSGTTQIQRKLNYRGRLKINNDN